VSNIAFHKDVFLPERLANLAAQFYNLKYTKHARQACLSDRYGVITPPFHVDLKPNQIIEAYLCGKTIEKITVRVDYNSDFDLVMVLIPLQGKATVKTCWLNSRNDTHKTLDASVFGSEKDFQKILDGNRYD
jgi:hypothetical protein